MAFHPAVQLEAELETNDNKDAKPSEPEAMQDESSAPMNLELGMQYSLSEGPFDSMPTNDPTILRETPVGTMQDQEIMTNLDLGFDTSVSWEMIGLGVEEPMPTQKAIDELYDFHPQL